MSKIDLTEIEILNSIAQYSRQYGTVSEKLRVHAILQAVSQVVPSQENPGYIRSGINNLTEDEQNKVNNAIEYFKNAPDFELELTDKLDQILCDYIKSSWINNSIISFKKVIPVLIVLIGLAFGTYKILYPNKWRATYFSNRNLSGSPFGTYKESNIDHNWGTDAPKNGMSPNNFSARFETNLIVSNAGEYTFSIRSDDGIRVFVDDQILLDFWIPQDFLLREATSSLTEGEHKVRVEYFEAEAGARLQFEIKNADNTVELDFPN